MQVDRAEVLFDYITEQSDELSIRVGEILEVYTGGDVASSEQY